MSSLGVNRIKIFFLKNDFKFDYYNRSSGLMNNVLMKFQCVLRNTRNNIYVKIFYDKCVVDSCCKLSLKFCRNNSRGIF